MYHLTISKPPSLEKGLQNKQNATVTQLSRQTKVPITLNKGKGNALIKEECISLADELPRTSGILFGNRYDTTSGQEIETMAPEPP